MGYLQALWDIDADPDVAPTYVPYSFVPLGHQSPVNMSMGRDFARRETVVVIPGVDSVLSYNGRNPGAMERRDQPFSFRVFSSDNDAAFDLLAAQIAPGVPKRLVYVTDSGQQRFTNGYDSKIQSTLVTANKAGWSGYQDFNVTWRIRPYWTLRSPEAPAQPVRFSPLHTEVFSPLHNERFLAPGMTPIVSASQAFQLDATGTAGKDLPTIPNRAMLFYFQGPMGGDDGIEVINYDSWIKDKTGAKVQRLFTLPFNLPTSADSAFCDFPRMKFWHNGIGFRPYKPDYQPEYFQVENGIINNCAVNGLGANILTGGYLDKTWYKWFA